MFIKNKYYRWYYQIIDKARKRGVPDEYYEKHHVIPRCMGGKNTEWNIVKLTFKEHYIAHWLLTRMTRGQVKIKMFFALFRMASVSYDQERKVPSWLSVLANSALGRARREYKVSDETKLKLSRIVTERGVIGEKNPFFGKKHTVETLYRIRQDATPRNNLGVRGISKKKDGYSARISLNGKVRYLGKFATADEAAQAYNTALVTGKYPVFKERRTSGTLCSVEGCGKLQKKRGFCYKHHWRVYRGSGDPNIILNWGQSKRRPPIVEKLEGAT